MNKNENIEKDKKSLRAIVEGIIVLIMFSILTFIFNKYKFPILHWLDTKTIKNYYLVIGILLIIALSYFCLRLHKRYNKIKKDYEDIMNPYNPNINKFNLGDQVILKREKNGRTVIIMSVYKIHSSEIECRKNKDLIRYTPEELMTAEETKAFIKKGLSEDSFIQEEHSKKISEYLG